MSRIVILNAEPLCYNANAIKIIRGFAEYKEIDLDYIIKNNIAIEADGLIVRLERKIDKKVLDHFIGIKYIVSATTGLDHIDLKYSEEKNIKIISLRNHKDFIRTIPSTAEFTWGLVLSLIRNIPQAYQSVKNGKWDRDMFKGYQLKGKTIGIVGLGRIGKMIAKYASAFEMEVLFYDPYVYNPLFKKVDSLNTLLSNSDIVTVHVHLSDSTYNLLNKNNLTLMKKGSFIVNTSRGGIVNEKDLVSEIENKKLGGVAFDVLENELEGLENNELYKASKKYTNILITPHIGGASYDAMAACEIFTANELKKTVLNS